MHASMPHAHSPQRVATAPVVAAGVLAITLLLALVGLAGATHQSGTLSDATPNIAWSNPTLGGANANESSCLENVNCETYVLTLAAGDYTGQRVSVAISWLNPASDWDLYVHEGSANGPIVAQSGDFVPDNEERASISIDAVIATPRTYYVHVVAFAVVAPGYDGTASLISSPNSRAPIFLAGNLPFSQNVRLQAPFTTGDGEPSLRVDVRGNCYVGGIRGVPAGVDLWRFNLDPASPTFDPGMQNPLYLGQPDAFLPQGDPNDPAVGGADGGGDIDISVGFPTHPDSTPVVVITSLALAQISSARSFDRGQSFILNPAASNSTADDRQWNESTGPNRVYMMYRAPAPATGLFVQRSDDYGATYPITSLVSPSGTTPGYIDVDQRATGPFAGRVYVSHASSSSLTIGHSIDLGLTWKNNTVDNTTGHGSKFDAVKVGADGTVYAVWSDEVNIYLAHSTDGAVTWSEKVRVNDNTVYRRNLFPWLECGSTGRVAVVWYGTTHATNDDDADWEVLFSQTLDATAANPTFRQQVISDHIIHGSNISLGGLDPTGDANRNLIDYFQVALDPQGAAVVAFTDDHNDYDGNVQVTRQLGGMSLYADANGTGQVSPASPPPLPVPGPLDPEVTDFLHDAVVGLLQPADPADNAFDILSVDYTCDGTDSFGNVILSATMAVSDLSPVPAGGNWRISFAANCPGGVSDNGDQFFLLADSNNPASPTFTWGTAVRASDGSMTYTNRGPAQGAFDESNNRLTMSVSVGDLNPFASPDIAVGSVLHGLRGRSYTGANGILDITYGGTQFLVPACSPTSTLLARFESESADEGVLLVWEFGYGTDLRVISVERGESREGPFGSIEFESGTRNGASTALDRTALPGHTYHYRLLTQDSAGGNRTFGPVAGSYGVDAGLPAVAFLGRPSPNPTGATSAVQFGVPRPGFVDLAIYDPRGRRVRTIVAGEMAPGLYTRSWDGRTDRFSDAASGLYFYVLNSVGGRKSQRVSLTR